MAYDYGTQGATLDFPNPYRLENQFLAARGAVLGLSGLWLLVQARSVSAGEAMAGGAAIGQGLLTGGLVAAAALLLALALFELGRAARQLRIFFGRGQPASLAPDLPRDAEGSSPRARALADTLRQGAIALAAPSGALNGVLYSLLQHLVTAPLELRRHLEVRFANLVATLGLLLLFASTMLLTRQPGAQALAALLYVLLGGSLVVRTYLRGADGVVALQPLAVMGLLVFGIVGTVLLGKLAGHLGPLEALSALSLPTIATTLLCTSVLVEALGLLAGRAQLDAPPPASTASEQVAVSFNADPNLLVQAIDRELQTRWVEGIPNRRYMWQTPQIEAPQGAGSFSAMLLEESQPMPPEAVRSLSWAVCQAFPRYRWLAAMDAVGVLLTAIGCLLWLGLASALTGQQAPAHWSPLSIGLILIVLGSYALRVAHRLWGRQDFESTLTWLEFNGSYARAQMALGGQLTDRVRSERTVVNVESMTLRAWVVRVRSVVFRSSQPDQDVRWLVGMSGEADAARGWVQQVRDFAQAQSTLVVPGSAADAQRLQQLHGANELAGQPAATGAGLLGQAGPTGVLGTSHPGGATAPAPVAAAGPAHCTHCGTALSAGARYCGQCGTAVARG